MNDPFQELNATSLYELAGGIDAAIKRLAPPTKEGMAQLGNEDNTILERIEILEHLTHAALNASLGLLHVIRDVVAKAHNEIQLLAASQQSDRLTH